MDVGLVDKTGALGLRQDEVGEEEQAEVGIKGDPGDDIEGPVLSEGEAGYNDPVHQPWCQLGGIRGAKGLVGGKDGEEDSDDGPGKQSVLMLDQRCSCLC